MRYKLIAPILFILICACSSLKQTKMTQGVSGYIYLRTGNQMPTIGRAASQGRGVSRDVYFYEPTTAARAKGSSPMFWAIDTKMVLHVKSDSTGAYKAGLPAGNYSVFVKEGDLFFGAMTDGNGTINPVNVAPNNVTLYNLTITANATF